MFFFFRNSQEQKGRSIKTKEAYLEIPGNTTSPIRYQFEVVCKDPFIRVGIYLNLITFKRMEPKATSISLVTQNKFCNFLRAEEKDFSGSFNTYFLIPSM